MSVNVVRNRRSRWSWSGVAVIAVLLASVAALSPRTTPVEAAKGGTCEPFTVTTGGRTYTGDQDTIIPAAQVGAAIVVQGKYVRFQANASSFAVRNYTLTGADSPRPDKDLPIDAPTVVFVSKIPNHGQTLTSAVELDLNNEGVVLRRSGGGQSMKIQAKNCAQGGLFQMEPQPGTTETNTLGPDFRYTTVPPGQTRLCFTNDRFSGYDSPQAATLVRNTAKIATWRVAAGGRIGMVVGEDAVEGGCQP